MTYKLTVPNEHSHGTKLIDVETGLEVKRIQSLDLHLRVDQLNRAEICLLWIAGDVTSGAARFVIGDPIDGENRDVRRVEYADDSGFEIVNGRLMRIDAER